MTIQKYEQNLEKIKKVWHKYPDWIKYWTRELLKDQLAKVK